MMTHDEMIAVIAAHRDGKQIQIRDANPNYQRIWVELGDAPLTWNFGAWEYRIKPSLQKPREWWIIEVCKGAIIQGFSHKSHAAEAVKALNLSAGSDEYASLIHVIEVLPSSGEPPVTDPNPRAAECEICKSRRDVMTYGDRLLCMVCIEAGEDVTGDSDPNPRHSPSGGGERPHEL